MEEGSHLDTAAVVRVDHERIHMWYSRLALNSLYWSSRMGALLPFLHFRRGDLQRPIFPKEASKLVPLQKFFQSPVVLNAS